MIKIYGSIMSRASRNAWAAEEAGAAYDIVALDFRKAEHKQPAFLAINPAGKMPAIVDGDVVMSESLAINLYIAQTYGKGTVWPSAAKDQARCLQWTMWAGAELEPVAYGRLREVFFKKPEERDAKLLAELAEKAKPIVEVLNVALAQSPYLLGASFTVADLNAACVMEYLVRSEFDLSPWPKVAAWYQACTGRPAYRKVQDLRVAAMKAAA
ncbi:MAG: glutathione S-transferase family protein [Rhodospirillaceae bacterium]|nr:glutathione S-transferase family protein [Rhodospirillaceae bacterium]